MRFPSNVTRFQAARLLGACNDHNSNYMILAPLSRSCDTYSFYCILVFLFCFKLNCYHTRTNDISHDPHYYQCPSIHSIRWRIQICCSIYKGQLQIVLESLPNASLMHSSPGSFKLSLNRVHDWLRYVKAQLIENQVVAMYLLVFFLSWAGTISSQHPDLKHVFQGRLDVLIQIGVRMREDYKEGATLHILSDRLAIALIDLAEVITEISESETNRIYR